MITSTSNARVKDLIQLRKKAKERNERDVFVTEGPKMFRETPSERLLETFISESFYRKEQKLFDDGRPVTVLSDRVFESVSDTRTPQGVLCVVRQFHYQLEDLMGRRPAMASDAGTSRAITAFEAGDSMCQTGNAKVSAPLLIALENLQDPGNLGTILRTAEGAGVTGILLGPGCVDIYNPKVIRSTMGSIYRVPFYYTEDLRRDLQALRQKGVRWYAAHLEGSVPYDEISYNGPAGFLIGNESRGLTQETAALADQSIRIPMCGQVESLNASVAASLLMYEANRKRRNAKKK
ncbi:MAG: RNA methyltransferase [Clostridiales bacterium]|nr:RNA methyltransferase [Clostridiales bacterium]